MNKKKVTSSDVAKYAGVSQTTVSMILNKKYNVSFSKEVVKKVEDAARELGYVLPKRRTQKESRREKLLVVFCPNLTNPYYVMLYNGKYYLICCAEPYRNVAFYRIDLMCDITDKTKQSVLDKTKWISEYRKPKRDVKGLPLEWNDTVASRFQTEHMNMFYGEPTTIRIKIDHPLQSCCQPKPHKCRRIS